MYADESDLQLHTDTENITTTPKLLARTYICLSLRTTADLPYSPPPLSSNHDLPCQIRFAHLSTLVPTLHDPFWTTLRPLSNYPLNQHYINTTLNHRYLTQRYVSTPFFPSNSPHDYLPTLTYGLYMICSFQIVRTLQPHYIRTNMPRLKSIIRSSSAPGNPRNLPLALRNPALIEQHDPAHHTPKRRKSPPSLTHLHSQTLWPSGIGLKIANRSLHRPHQSSPAPDQYESVASSTQMRKAGMKLTITTPTHRWRFVPLQ